MFNDIPIEEYFRYHPPQTPERQAKHDRVNAVCLKVAKDLTQPFLSNEEMDTAIGSLDELLDISLDKRCAVWAAMAIERTRAYASAGEEEGIVMSIQQARMFLNQGITIDEFRQNLHEQK